MVKKILLVPALSIALLTGLSGEAQANAQGRIYNLKGQQKNQPTQVNKNNKHNNHNNNKNYAHNNHNVRHVPPKQVVVVKPQPVRPVVIHQTAHRHVYNTPCYNGCNNNKQNDTIALISLGVLSVGMLLAAAK